MTQEKSPKKSTKGTFDSEEFTPEEERELQDSVNEMVEGMREQTSE